MGGLLVSQKLRGFVGQSLKAGKRGPQTYTALYPSGSYTFTPTINGFYKFHLWGSGGNGTAGPTVGASGAYCEFTAYLTVRDGVTLGVDRVTQTTPTLGATTATFPNGKVVSAGSATTTTPGVATGGDVNLPGVAGASTTGGAAPGTATMRGGAGGTVALVNGNTPGGGGTSGSASGDIGGDGLIVIVRVPK